MNEPTPHRTRAPASSGILTDIGTGAAIAVLIAVGLACLVVGAIYLRLIS